MSWAVFLFGAGPEGLCGQNRSALGETSRHWGDREDSRPMFVQEHEAEQNVQLFFGSSWNNGPDKVGILKERCVSINNMHTVFLDTCVVLNS